MPTYQDIIAGIITEEKDTIGALAIQKAEEVPDLSVDDDGNIKSINGDGEQVLGELVEKYESVVGEAIGSTIRHQSKKGDLPDLPENVQKYVHS
ncbi:MAG: hypothetical protein ABEJ69_01710 [Candidatus Nanohaloarchaea archaeon]